MPAQAARSYRIAIVCRDDAAGDAITDFVATLGLEPIISLEPEATKSSLETLEVLRQADFALVLQADRRMEIGFLLGALGRGRVLMLQPEDSEEGTLGGLTRHPMDGAGLWRLLLAREMKQAGLEIDLNRAV